MEEKKITKQEVLYLISDWVGCTDNEFSCSTEDTNKIYYKLEQVEDFINNQEQQLQLKDKMIELMAKDIIWLGSNKDKKSNGKQIDIVLSNYEQQALAELEE